MTTPRKHHFLPQFYLRGFSPNSASLYQIWKSTGRHAAVRIKDIAAVRDFHRLDVDDASDPHAIERVLAKAEGEFSVYLADLLRDGVVNVGALGETIGLAGMLRMRVPAVKRYISSSLSEHVRRSAAALLKQGVLPPVPDDVDLGEELSGLSIEISNWKCLDLMFRMASEPRALEAMRNMKATLLRAPNGSFITCDQPVALFHPDIAMTYGVGPVTHGVEISLPLSSAALLLLNDDAGSDEERFASSAEIDEFNRRTVVMAEKFVYAGYLTAELIGLVSRHKQSNAGFQVDRLNTAQGVVYVNRFVPVAPDVGNP
jgi:hypothetical protein